MVFPLNMFRYLVTISVFPGYVAPQPHNKVIASKTVCILKQIFINLHVYDNWQSHINNRLLYCKISYSKKKNSNICQKENMRF